MTSKERFPLALASSVASEILESLIPACERIYVAGSIRRRRPDVGDIELLVIPKFRDVKDLFQTTIEEIDCTDDLLTELISRGILRRRGAWGHLNKFFTHNRSGIPVDIFVGTRENWGRDLLVRTGSADFNRRVMTRLKEFYAGGHAYGDAAVTTRDGYRLTAPDEETMFNYLEWDWIPPEKR